MGLDWEKIRKDYEERATPEELNAADWEGKKPRPKRRKSRATGEKRTGNYWTGPRQKQYDVEAIILAYKEGKTCRQIAEEFGCNDSTVRNYCRDAGVYDPKRDKGGSKPKEVCSRGHVYEEVGFFVTKKGGKDCKACSCERGTKSKRRKRALQRQALERS